MYSPYARRSNPNTRWGTTRVSIPKPPAFITARPTISYSHLPRHTVSEAQDGNLSDRIGWVVLNKDLIGHVEARLRHIPDALTHVQAYRALARAAPSYALLKRYLPKVGAPKTEKEKAVQVAAEGYQAIIEAAENVIATLSTPTVARALNDLLPFRRQHGTSPNNHVLERPQRIDDYQDPEWEHKELTEDEKFFNRSTWSPVSWTPYDADDAASPPSTDSTSGSTSTDSLPALDTLDVRSLSDREDDEDYESSELSYPDSDPDEADDEAPKVVNQPPPPPPPHAPGVIVNEPRPPRTHLMRGLDNDDRLLILDPSNHIFIAYDNHFPLRVEQVEALYRRHWPGATPFQTHRAAIIVDDFTARHLNVPVSQPMVPDAPLIGYREAMQLSEKQKEQWRQLEDEAFTEAHAAYICSILPPASVQDYFVRY